MRRIISLSILLLTFCLAGMAQPCNPQSTANGSPCSQQTPATAFCADENPYGVTYPSSTNSPSSEPFTGNTHVDCCYTTPNPAWYYFQIDQSGTLTIHIEQHSNSGSGLDVDFVCWGPFNAVSQADFTNQLCCGQLNISSSTVVDCSYSPAAVEDCNFGNVQAGQWYLLLLTNYSNQAGSITFNSTSNSSASTNCDLLNSGDSNSPICEGSILELYVTAPQPGATYNWTGPNGFAQSTTSTTLQIPNVTANMSGEYHMTMSGITQNSNEAVVQVTINPTPTPEIVAEHEAICLGESTELVAGGNHTNYSYKWSGKPFGGNYSIIANNVSTLTVNPTESYRYVLIAQANECTGVDSIDIIVNPNPEIEITIDNPYLCYGEGTNITATGGAHYHWSNGGNTSTIYVAPNQTTTYSVEVQTAELCSGDTTVEIVVYPELHSTYSALPSYCGQPTGEITMTATGGMGKYTFTAPGANFDEDVASNLHTGTFTVTTTDSVGCFITTVAEVPAEPGPTPCFIFATSDDVNMTITNCTQGNNNTYFWDFGDGVTAMETHPTHEYMDPGRYTVRMVVTDEHNCVDSTYQDYVINGPVYIANAFSPNGDGINDMMFVIGKTIQAQEFLWAIYDRHGSLVFISTDPTIGWDGTMLSGKDAPSGVYVYRLKYRDVNGNYFERDGNITLIR